MATLLDYARRAGNYALNPLGETGGALTNAGRALTAGLSGGAATGVFPQMPTGGTPAPRSLASQAQVRAVDSNPANAAAIAAAPTIVQPPAAPGAPAPNSLAAIPMRGSVNDLGGWSAPAADRVAQLERDAAASRALSDRSLALAQQGVGVPATPGMGLIGPADYANRNADFNDSAALRTLAARGAAPGRAGAQAFDAQVAAAQMPLAMRAQQREVDTQQAGATQRAQLAEGGLAARALMQDRREAVGQDIDRARLGIDAIRASSSGLPAGYRAKADGTGLEPIPGGPADPNTPKGKNTLNETQAKALQFGTRMQQAGLTLDRLAAGGVNQPGLIKRGLDTVGLGVVGNFTQSPEQQQVEQAQRDFVNATLRRESGAAISEAEFASARQQYFPQPGDSPEVIAQKRTNRELATRGFLAEVPDGQNRVQQIVGATGQGAAAAGAAGNAAAPSLPGGASAGGRPIPSQGAVEDGYVYLGGDPSNPASWRKQ